MFHFSTVAILLLTPSAALYRLSLRMHPIPSMVNSEQVLFHRIIHSLTITLALRTT